MQRRRPPTSLATPTTHPSTTTHLAHPSHTPRYRGSNFDSMLKAFFGILFAAIGISQSALQFPE